MSKKVKKSIANKFAWTILSFIVLYLVASAFNLVPQSMKNTVNWGASNFGLIVFFLCFSMVFFLIIRFTKRSKKSNGNF